MRDMSGYAQTSDALMSTEELCFDADSARLIDRLSLTIAEGRRLVILGANGAGKSLTLRLLHGLISPSKGEVRWRGRPLDAAARRDQALVFQRPVLLRRSVRGNLRFALNTRRLGRAERREREEEALSQAQLVHLADRPARLLSGGEQQRLALARALACRPRLLLLDEPTASLDPAATLAVEQMILNANDTGVSVVMVTHDAGQARRVGHEIAFMHAGGVVEQGTPDAVLENPQSGPAAAWRAGRLFIEPNAAPNE
ncbi:MAG: ATP-binding cassette domain-containing protein [Pseudomonadota bacterium]